MIKQILKLKKNGISVTFKSSKTGPHWLCVRFKKEGRRIDYEMSHETFADAELVARLLDDAPNDFLKP